MLKKGCFRKSLLTGGLVAVLMLSFILQSVMVVQPVRAADAYVRVNQVGYPVDAPKRAYLLTYTATSGDFEVKRESDDVTVYTGSIGANQGGWSNTYGYVYELDFDDFEDAGTYYIEVDGESSVAFEIGTPAVLYDTLLENTQSYFENFQRDTHHENDEEATVYHIPQYAEIVDPGGNTGWYLADDLEAIAGAAKRDVSGGWYDAGDFVKFVSNAAYAADMMLVAVRDRPDLVGSGQAADFFGEARWGLDWLEKMWDDSSGTLYYQVGIGTGNEKWDDWPNYIAGDHSAWRLPHHDESESFFEAHQYRYVLNRPLLRASFEGATEKLSPNLAGRLSAAFALGYQVYKDVDPAFANDCLTYAENIYAAADTNPSGDLLTASPHAFYPEHYWQDDMELGAVELYYVTDDDRYLSDAADWAYEYINAATSTLNLYDVSALAHYELYKAMEAAGSTGLAVDKQDLLDDLQRQVDQGVAQAESAPFDFGSATSEFDAVSMALGLSATTSMYLELAEDDLSQSDYDKYAAFGQRQMDAVLGANAWGTSFIIGAGEIYPHNPHNQTADLQEVDLIGGVVNGPNATEQVTKVGTYCMDSPHPMKNCDSSVDLDVTDPFYTEFSAGSGGPSDAAYVDDVRSWATVENAIDFAGTAILAYVRQYGDEGGTLIDLVGDKDNFHPGDAVDDPPLSQTALDIIAEHEENFAVILDVGGMDRPVGVTHDFTVPGGAPINGATLTFTFRGRQWIKNDMLQYEKVSYPGHPVIVLRDLLGFEPEPDPDEWLDEPGPTYTVTVDLAEVPVRLLETNGDWALPGPGNSWPERDTVPDAHKALYNLLPELEDGQLDLVFVDDVELDYSELKITYGTKTATPAGQRVTAAPVAGVYVTFDEVTAAGTTTAAPGSGSAIVPPDYELLPNTSLDLETTATYQNANTVLLRYDESQVADEARVRLLHAEDGEFVDRTLYVDQKNNWVAGRVDSFSEFAVAEFTGALLTDFTIYATEGVQFGPGADQLLSGDVGSNGSVVFNDTSTAQTLVGSIQALGDVRVGRGTTVNGDVVSGGDVTVLGQVAGTVEEHAVLSPLNIVLPVYDFVAGSDVSFSSDDKLQPGTYRHVTVADGAVVQLESGVYYVQSFTVEAYAGLTFNAAEGPVIVRVGTPDGVPEPVSLPLTMGAYATMDLVTGATTDVRFQIMRPGQLEVGEGAQVLGVLTAPQNRAVFGESSELHGAVYAQSVRVEMLDDWQAYVYYEVGDRVYYEGTLYECRIAHTALPGWTPDNTPSLWRIPTPDGTTEWAPNTAYAVGSVVTYNGVTYEALQSHTSILGWEPPNTPSLWRVK